MDYPVLSCNPVLPLRGGYRDGTIKSQPEDGALKTRQRFTAPARRTWGIQYAAMPGTDFDAFEAFYRVTAKQGAEIFNWRVPGRNLLAFPNTFDNAVWIAEHSVGVVSPVVSSPFYPTAAALPFYKLVYPDTSAGGAFSDIYQRAAPQVALSGKQFTFSVDLAAAAGNPDVILDVSAEGAGVADIVRVVSVPSDFTARRYSLTGVFSSAIVDPYPLDVFIRSAGQVAKTVYVSRAQLEEGAFATPYRDSRQVVPVRFAAVPQWQDRIVDNAIAYDVSFELEEA